MSLGGTRMLLAAATRGTAGAAGAPAPGAASPSVRPLSSFILTARAKIILYSNELRALVQ